MSKYRNSPYIIRSIAASCFAITTATTSAALVQIDFGTSASAVEPGYVAQTSGTATPYSTAEGIITVASTGSFFNRSAGTTVTPSTSYTSAPLFGDFTFLNNTATNALTLTIAGAGIVANQSYEIEFFSYDSQHAGGGGTVTYAGLSGTGGGTSIAYSNSFTNNNSSLSTFTANGSGEIVLGVTGTNEGPRISGMIINSSPVPEPSSTAILGLGGLALILRRRK